MVLMVRMENENNFTGNGGRRILNSKRTMRTSMFASGALIPAAANLGTLVEVIAQPAVARSERPRALSRSPSLASASVECQQNAEGV